MQTTTTWQKNRQKRGKTAEHTKNLKRNVGPQITHEIRHRFPRAHVRIPAISPVPRQGSRETHAAATVPLKIIKWIKASECKRILTVVPLDLACCIEIGCPPMVSGWNRIVSTLFSVSFPLITNRYIREYKLSTMNVIFSRLLIFCRVWSHH